MELTFLKDISLKQMRLSQPASVQAAINSFDLDPQLGMGETLNSSVLLCAGVALNGFILRLIGVPRVPRLLSLAGATVPILSISNSYNPYLFYTIPCALAVEELAFYPLEVRWQRRWIQETHLSCKEEDVRRTL